MAPEIGIFIIGICKNVRRFVYGIGLEKCTAFRRASELAVIVDSCQFKFMSHYSILCFIFTSLVFLKRILFYCFIAILFLILFIEIYLFTKKDDFILGVDV